MSMSQSAQSAEARFSIFPDCRHLPESPAFFFVINIETQSERAQSGMTVCLPLRADIFRPQMSGPLCISFSTPHAYRAPKPKKICISHTNTGSPQNDGHSFTEFGSLQQMVASWLLLGSSARPWTSSKVLQCAPVCGAKGHTLAWGSTQCLFSMPSSAT